LLDLDQTGPDLDQTKETKNISSKQEQDTLAKHLLQR